MEPRRSEAPTGWGPYSSMSHRIVLFDIASLLQPVLEVLNANLLKQGSPNWNLFADYES